MALETYYIDCGELPNEQVPASKQPTADFRKPLNIEFVEFFYDGCPYTPICNDLGKEACRFCIDDNQYHPHIEKGFDEFVAAEMSRLTALG